MAGAKTIVNRKSIFSKGPYVIEFCIAFGAAESEADKRQAVNVLLPLTIQDRLVYIYGYDAPNPHAVAAWPAP